MLRVSQESAYLYSESDAPDMLNKLLEKGLIELSKLKHAEEVGRTNYRKYYEYHMIISHPIEKFNTFRR